MLKQPSVFLAPQDISGYYACLARALCNVGCRTEFLSLGNVQFADWRVSDSAFPVRAFGWADRLCRAARSFSYLNPRRYIYISLRKLFQAVLVTWVALCFDIIVLKSGESILHNGWDIRLYRKFGRIVIAIFHGSDSRPPYLVPERSDYSATQLRDRAVQTRERVDRANALCHYIVDNPLASHFQSTKCCMYQMLGNILDDIKLAPGNQTLRLHATECPTTISNHPVRILHAPSVISLKGTEQIRACIERMKCRGHRIDYIEISGRPNDEVMKELASCDFVIDELYSDIHGAYLALEASAFAKPALNKRNNR